MTETTLATTTHDEHEETILAALSPSEVQGAQAQLGAWVAARIAATETEAEEIRESLDIAIRSAWEPKPWRRRLDAAKRALVYYEKLREAVEAGYLIIPSLPMEVFAVRVSRKLPTGERVSSAWEARQEQGPNLLPAGQGRYVQPRPTVAKQEYPSKDREGKPVTLTEYWPKAFQDVQFPVVLAKPIILNAARQALARKLFDEVGVVVDSAPSGALSRKRDPILAGRIRNPRQQGTDPTFFLGWWLDPSTLRA